MKTYAGGSAANVTKAIAQLGKHVVSVELVGALGRDAVAQEYKQQMNLAGVGTAALLESEHPGAPSAQALCLVTPDGQRTMRVSLGAASELDEKRVNGLVACALLSSAQLLHVEGYCLRRPGAARASILATSSSGGVVSIDLASTDIVEECYETLHGILKLNAVDLVFGNEEEIEALGIAEAKATGKPIPDGPGARESGVEFLLQYVQVVNITLGADGSLTVRKDGERFLTPALPVTALDTTGAGDTYTAGFLWALLHGAPLPICAAQGCAMAAEMVKVLGSTLEDASWKKLREGSYGYQPHRPSAAPAAPSGPPTSQSIGTMLGLDRNDYSPARPPVSADSDGAMKAAASRGDLWGNSDDQYDPKNSPSQPNTRASDFTLNDDGQLVKIKRTMSGRIYGAVFEQIEQCGPPVKGSLRRSMSSRVNDDMGFKTGGSQSSMARTDSSATIMAVEAAGGCGAPGDYNGYSSYIGYLMAWGMGWLESEELTPDNASTRMRRSMSSRVMQEQLTRG